MKTAGVGERRYDPLDFPAAAIAHARDAHGMFTGTVTLTSTLPIAAGLASSAACLIATLAAVGGELGASLEPEAICRLAVRVERDRLQTGAGEMDFFSCGLGGTQLTTFEAEHRTDARQFPSVRSRIVIGDSQAQAATAVSIARKRERFAANEKRIVEYQGRTDALVRKMGMALANTAELTAVGPYVTSCHEAISELMASSTERIDEMVKATIEAGAAGAKLTGGGEGGCMFAIANGATRAEGIAVALEALGATAYQTSISADGVTSTTV